MINGSNIREPIANLNYYTYIKYQRKSDDNTTHWRMQNRKVPSVEHITRFSRNPQTCTRVNLCSNNHTNLKNYLSFHFYERILHTIFQIILRPFRDVWNFDSSNEHDKCREIIHEIIIQKCIWNNSQSIKSTFTSALNLHYLINQRQAHPKLVSGGMASHVHATFPTLAQPGFHGPLY